MEQWRHVRRNLDAPRAVVLFSRSIFLQFPLISGYGAFAVFAADLRELDLRNPWYLHFYLWRAGMMVAFIAVIYAASRFIRFGLDRWDNWFFVSFMLIVFGLAWAYDRKWH